MAEEKVNVSLEDKEEKKENKINAINKRLADKKENKEEKKVKLIDQLKQLLDFKTVLIGLGVGVLAAALIFFIFDLTDVRTNTRNKVVNFLMGYERNVLESQLRQEYESKLENLVKENVVMEKNELAALRSEVEKTMKELKIREKELETKEKNISSKEEELKEYEQELIIKEEQIDGRIKEIDNLIDIYEEMEAKDSLEILQSMEDRALVKNIIINMNKKYSSQILALMDSKEAADIINEMSEGRE